MLCYKDKTFCVSPCINKTCTRLLTGKIREDAEKSGLTIAQCDFRCEFFESKEKKDER